MTTIKETQCQCTHLTSFGSDFVVPPNSIDFNNVFTTERFLESMPVFCTVIVIMLLYVAVLVWARRQDKLDLVKVICGTSNASVVYYLLKCACYLIQTLYTLCSGAPRHYKTTYRRTRTTIR